MSWYRAVLVLPLLVSACGFQVRSDARFPPQMSVIYIDAVDRFSHFYRALVLSIRESELTLTSDPGSADTVIRVLHDETGRRTLSVSARNVPTEYEAYYVVRFAVLFEGAEVVPSKQVQLTRIYTYDETLVLGKELEEEELRKAIAADLVGMLVQQVAVIN